MSCLRLRFCQVVTLTLNFGRCACKPRPDDRRKAMTAIGRWETSSQAYGRIGVDDQRYPDNAPSKSSAALSPERTVTFKSEFLRLSKMSRVTPEPIQKKPHPPIWLGGFHAGGAAPRGPPSANGFTVPGANRDVYDRYVAELEEKVNRPTDNLRFASGLLVPDRISDDPERELLPRAADHVILSGQQLFGMASGWRPSASCPRHLKRSRSAEAKRTAAGGRL